MRTLYFCPVVSSIFFFLSSPNLSGSRVDVYHTPPDVPTIWWTSAH